MLVFLLVSLFCGKTYRSKGWRDVKLKSSASETPRLDVDETGWPIPSRGPMPRDGTPKDLAGCKKNSPFFNGAKWKPTLGKSKRPTEAKRYGCG